MTDEGRPLSVVAVAPDAAALNAVVGLWRKNSRTLGLMPQGGFVEAAQDGRLLAAIDEGGTVLGYVMYRLARDAAAVVHLCVSEAARGRGVAHRLIADLRERVKNRRGIGLRCRNDFPATKIWPRLGFVPLSESIGRADKPLTQWWMDFAKASLFSGLQQRLVADHTVVGIDANVFFDLYEESARPAALESRVLLEDWLGDIRLVVTDEIYADIARHKSAEARDVWRARAARHHPLICGPDAIDTLLPQVEKLAFRPRSEQDRSDLRHLVRCIATGTRYFVTRDSRLVDRSREFEDEFGITVCRPVDFAIGRDRAERGDAYRPIDLSGTSLSQRLVNDEDRNQLHVPFQNPRAPERRREFLARVRGALHVRGPGECRVVADRDGSLLALWSAVPDGDGVLRVDLLRARAHAAEHAIARHLVHHLLRRARASSAELVVVADSACQDSVRAALDLEGFASSGTSWVRALGRPGISAKATQDRLMALVSARADAADGLRRLHDGLAASIGNAEALLAAERALWPARFPELDLPCYIAPIQPRWAQHLFDVHLARGTLFGADPDLMLNREAVYYRSKQSAGLTAPARMLWYVSRGDREPGGMTLSAMSYIDEIIVGPATKLFRRFRRLGVYEWTDVRETGGGDPHGAVMAVRFSGTEPLARRLPWREFQPMLRAHGVRTTLVSPVRVPRAAFEQLVSAAEAAQ